MAHCFSFFYFILEPRRAHNAPQHSMVLLEALLLPTRAGADSGTFWERPVLAAPSLQLGQLDQCSQGLAETPLVLLQPKQGVVEPESIQYQH